MATSRQLLTTKQVAEILRVDRSTVLRDARAGKIPVAFRAPGERGAVYFDAEDVAEIAQREIEERSRLLASMGGAR
jgi:excisionase family DNA binding protein